MSFSILGIGVHRIRFESTESGFEIRGFDSKNWTNPDES
jgi:hypothetical protein